MIRRSIDSAQPDQRPRKSRIMVVDDHAIVLHGLSQLISSSDDLDVVLQAGTAESALEMLAKHPLPDLVITDISLPGLSGIELTRSIGQKYPQLPVMVLSMHDEMVHGERAYRAGARGYLNKHEATEKVTLAIRKILAGEDYMSEKMRTLLKTAVRGKEPNAEMTVLTTLTDREFEVFRLIAMGMATSDIARQLNRSAKTVESHRGRVKEKLGLRNASELNRFAIHWAERERV